MTSSYLSAAAGQGATTSADKGRRGASCFKLSLNHVGRVLILRVQLDVSQLGELDIMSGGSPLSPALQSVRGNGCEGRREDSGQQSRGLNELEMHLE